MDPGSTVDEHSEKWTTTASTYASQKCDNTADLTAGEITSYSSPLSFKKKKNYCETNNLHILGTSLKE